jgi:hypothetical protein
MSIVDEIGKESLKRYLENCAKVADIDIGAAFKVTLNCMKAHDGAIIPDDDMRQMKDLENRWYASLETGTPDYSVYSDAYYFCEVWMCWSKYSRRYLKEINAPKSMFGKSIVEYIGNVDNVVDLGCGFGYTTVGMKELFPNSNVYGTNLKDSYQYKMATELGDKHNFKIIENLTQVEKPGTSLFFASEYFEHFDRPIEHLIDVIEQGSPTYMLIANTFNGRAIGHFNQYKDGTEVYDGKQMGRLFGKTLRKYGYESVTTDCWNNRPAFWQKKDSCFLTTQYFSST